MANLGPERAGQRPNRARTDDASPAPWTSAPIKAANGPSQPGQIRAAQQVRVPLHDLRPDAHRLAVTYRPDTDEP